MSIEKQIIQSELDSLELELAVLNTEIEILKKQQANAHYDDQRLYDLLLDPKVNFGWNATTPANRKEKLRKKIGHLRWQLDYLSGKKKNSDTITPDDIKRAKSVPIESFYVGSLRKAGGKLWGRCSFHTEISASFTIYVAQNSFHCFGCGAHGDSIEFIMRFKNLQFIEAVRFLCKK